MDCYNVSPHDFYFAIVFPLLFLFKIIFVEFFFNIELVKNLALTFLRVLFPFFFRIIFADFIFFNIELVENLVL